jgi:hypothetical protein
MAFVRFQAVSEQELSRLSELIHDCWFDTKSVGFDPVRSELRVPFDRPSLEPREAVGKFLFLQRLRERITEWLIIIQGVQGYELEDAQGIGRYDFDRVRFNSNEQTIEVRTNIPTKFRVRVERIEVRVEETTRQVGERFLWRIR